MRVHPAFEGVKVVLRIRGSIVPYVSRLREGSGKPNSKDVGSKRSWTHNPLFPLVMVVVRSSGSPWRGTLSSTGGRTSPRRRVGLLPLSLDRDLLRGRRTREMGLRVSQIPLLDGEWPLFLKGF
ncbi:hypothetical protein PIB30_086324 [Stylosanthes scabra]|uniref:Uncharacterized protein n=1 Tax=Stylosanthes scabra TaxID=79078 RepID=A0ABU6TTU2_9FABA|nr:hypothetical protein [Stylosanthes scabra]